jgi:hypothetical protein
MSDIALKQFPAPDTLQSAITPSESMPISMPVCNWHDFGLRECRLADDWVGKLLLALTNNKIKEIRKNIMKNQINGLCLVLCLGLTTMAVGSLNGCAGNQYDRSTGEYIDDKSLTLRVHNALSDNQEYKFSDVNVNIFRGTVQLTGFVDTSDQKSKAEEIAKGVQGVKDVDNKISVKETH